MNCHNEVHYGREQCRQWGGCESTNMSGPPCNCEPAPDLLDNPPCGCSTHHVQASDSLRQSQLDGRGYYDRVPDNAPCGYFQQDLQEDGTPPCDCLARPKHLSREHEGGEFEDPVHRPFECSLPSESAVVPLQYAREHEHPCNCASHGSREDTSPPYSFCSPGSDRATSSQQISGGFDKNRGSSDYIKTNRAIQEGRSYGRPSSTAPHPRDSHGGPRYGSERIPDHTPVTRKVRFFEDLISDGSKGHGQVSQRTITQVCEEVEETRYHVARPGSEDEDDEFTLSFQNQEGFTSFAVLAKDDGNTTTITSSLYQKGTSLNDRRPEEFGPVRARCTKEISRLDTHALNGSGDHIGIGELPEIKYKLEGDTSKRPAKTEFVDEDGNVKSSQITKSRTQLGVDAVGSTGEGCTSSLQEAVVEHVTQLCARLAGVSFSGCSRVDNKEQKKRGLNPEKTTFNADGEFATQTGAVPSETALDEDGAEIITLDTSGLDDSQRGEVETVPSRLQSEESLPVFHHEVIPPTPEDVADETVNESVSLDVSTYSLEDETSVKKKNLQRRRQQTSKTSKTSLASERYDNSKPNAPGKSVKRSHDNIIPNFRYDKSKESFTNNGLSPYKYKSKMNYPAELDCDDKDIHVIYQRKGTCTERKEIEKLTHDVTELKIKLNELQFRQQTLDPVPVHKKSVKKTAAVAVKKLSPRKPSHKKRKVCPVGARWSGSSIDESFGHVKKSLKTSDLIVAKYKTKILDNSLSYKNNVNINADNAKTQHEILPKLHKALPDKSSNISIQSQGSCTRNEKNENQPSIQPNPKKSLTFDNEKSMAVTSSMMDESENEKKRKRDSIESIASESTAIDVADLTGERLNESRSLYALRTEKPTGPDENENLGHDAINMSEKDLAENNSSAVSGTIPNELVQKVSSNKTNVTMHNLSEKSQFPLRDTSQVRPADGVVQSFAVEISNPLQLSTASDRNGNVGPTKVQQQQQIFKNNNQSSSIQPLPNPITLSNIGPTPTSASQERPTYSSCVAPLILAQGTEEQNISPSLSMPSRQGSQEKQLRNSSSAQQGESIGQAQPSVHQVHTGAEFQPGTVSRDQSIYCGAQERPVNNTIGYHEIAIPTNNVPGSDPVTYGSDVPLQPYGFVPQQTPTAQCSPSNNMQMPIAFMPNPTVMQNQQKFNQFRQYHSQSNASRSKIYQSTMVPPPHCVPHAVGIDGNGEPVFIFPAPAYPCNTPYPNTITPYQPINAGNMIAGPNYEQQHVLASQSKESQANQNSPTNTSTITNCEPTTKLVPGKGDVNTLKYPGSIFMPCIPQSVLSKNQGFVQQEHVYYAVDAAHAFMQYMQTHSFNAPFINSRITGPIQTHSQHLAKSAVTAPNMNMSVGPPQTQPLQPSAVHVPIVNAMHSGLSQPLQSSVVNTFPNMNRREIPSQLSNRPLQSAVNAPNMNSMPARSQTATNQPLQASALNAPNMNSMLARPQTATNQPLQASAVNAPNMNSMPARPQTATNQPLQASAVNAPNMNSMPARPQTATNQPLEASAVNAPNMNSMPAKPQTATNQPLQASAENVPNMNTMPARPQTATKQPLQASAVNTPNVSSMPARPSQTSTNQSSQKTTENAPNVKARWTVPSQVNNKLYHASANAPYADSMPARRSQITTQPFQASASNAPNVTNRRAGCTIASQSLTVTAQSKRARQTVSSTITGTSKQPLQSAWNVASSVDRRKISSKMTNQRLQSSVVYTNVRRVASSQGTNELLPSSALNTQRVGVSQESPSQSVNQTDRSSISGLRDVTHTQKLTNRDLLSAALNKRGVNIIRKSQSQTTNQPNTSSAQNTPGMSGSGAGSNQTSNVQETYANYVGSSNKSSQSTESLKPNKNKKSTRRIHFEDVSKPLSPTSLNQQIAMIKSDNGRAKVKKEPPLSLTIQKIRPTYSSESSETNQPPMLSNIHSKRTGRSKVSNQQPPESLAINKLNPNTTQRSLDMPALLSLNTETVHLNCLENIKGTNKLMPLSNIKDLDTNCLVSSEVTSNIPAELSSCSSKTPSPQPRKMAPTQLMLMAVLKERGVSLKCDGMFKPPDKETLLASLSDNNFHANANPRRKSLDSQLQKKPKKKGNVQKIHSTNDIKRKEETKKDEGKSVLKKRVYLDNPKPNSKVTVSLLSHKKNTVGNKQARPFTHGVEKLKSTCQKMLPHTLITSNKNAGIGSRITSQSKEIKSNGSSEKCVVSGEKTYINEGQPHLPVQTIPLHDPINTINRTLPNKTLKTTLPTDKPSEVNCQTKSQRPEKANSTQNCSERRKGNQIEYVGAVEKRQEKCRGYANDTLYDDEGESEGKIPRSVQRKSRIDYTLTESSNSRIRRRSTSSTRSSPPICDRSWARRPRPLVYDENDGPNDAIVKPRSRSLSQETPKKPKYQPRSCWGYWYTERRGLTKRAIEHMERICTTIWNDDDSIEFRHDVDFKRVVDYISIVKQPLCLHDICAKVKRPSYQTVDQFIHDMRRLIFNSRLYNARNSVLGKITTSLEAKINRLLYEVFECNFHHITGDPLERDANPNLQYTLFA